MTPEEVGDQLERIASAEDFPGRSAELVDRWTALKVGAEALEPILRFMEEHPSVEFGMPGSLVHFAERFYGSGYEEKLLGSLSRKPTGHTVWMLNRLINGAKVPATRKRYVAMMAEAKSHPQADSWTRERIDHFLIDR